MKKSQYQVTKTFYEDGKRSSPLKLTFNLDFPTESSATIKLECRQDKDTACWFQGKLKMVASEGWGS